MAVVPSRLLSLLPILLSALAGAVLLLPGLTDGTSAFTAIFTVELLLPLVGIAVVLGQLPRRIRPWAVLALMTGASAGLLFRETLYSLMAPVPGAAAHLFLAGPIACALTGLILILSSTWRPWIALPVLPAIAAALAVATRLGDPALYAAHYLETALALQACILVAVAWPVACFSHPVLYTAARIFGSWMLAVALLYGGAYLAGRETGLTPPPFAPIPTEAAASVRPDSAKTPTGRAP